MSFSLPRHAELWAPGLIRSWLRDRDWRAMPGTAPVCWLLFTDHWEPFGGGASPELAAARVALWEKKWPEIAARHRDDFDKPPCFTFFYPAEDYHHATLETLARLTRDGIADVEVHLHHDHDTAENFTGQMQEFTRTLRSEHGLLRDGAKGTPEWCFIHGNWALDNSRPDGRWCGLNNELTLLRELGCKADFTLPSAPSACQTSLVNAIYWAVDDPAKPKSHDQGVMLKPGTPPPADSLLMVQGPLTIRRHPKYHLIPNLEVGELAGNALPSAARTEAWLNAAPRVGNEVFLKLFGHGAQERNSGPLLNDGGLDRCLTLVKEACHARGWKLGFLSAWEATSRLYEIAGMPES